MEAEEREILQHIREGDIAAFEKVFRKYYSMLTLYAMRFMKRRELAEEIVQDLFYHFWEKRTSLTPETSLKSYLFRSVSNNCLKSLEHMAVVKRHAVSALQKDEQHWYQSDIPLETSELVKLTGEILASMPQRTREIFELSRYKGLKYNEIADQLAISVKTVEAHMGSALKMLRAGLHDYLPLLIFILFSGVLAYFMI